MNQISPLFAPLAPSPLAGLQLALAQTWFQMGMPPPEMFMSFIMQAMQSPAYGPQMSPFLSPFAGRQPDQTVIHVGMDGKVSAEGPDKGSILHGMTNLRDRLQNKYGDQDPRVVGLNGAIRGLAPQVPAPVVREHR